MVLNPIRLNWHYVIWYKNFTVIFVSLIVPFALLAYWNFNTLAVMSRRRRLKNRPTMSNYDAIAAALQNVHNTSPNSGTRSISTAGILANIKF